MKNTFLLTAIIITLAITTNINAQVGIGVSTTNIDHSAQLDVVSTTKGFLPPRMTEVQKNAISNPASGLLVYQTDVISGYYYYDGSVWKSGLGPQGPTGPAGLSATSTMAEASTTGSSGTYLLNPSPNNIYINAGSWISIGTNNMSSYYYVSGKLNDSTITIVNTGGALAAWPVNATVALVGRIGALGYQGPAGNDGSNATISIGAIGAATPNGANITAGVLSLAPADETNPGIITTTDQTIAGAKTFSADVTANSFVKSGGTAVQFLKADGSVDTNTYLTSSSLPTGTAGQTLRSDGTNWLADGAITNDGANVTIGFGNTATTYSIAMGNGTTASGLISTAMGYSTTASGLLSTAMGNHTTASGDQSTSMGNFVSTDNNAGSFILGDNSTETVTNSSVINSFTTRFGGGYRFYSDAAVTAAKGMFLTDGNVGIGTASPTAKLEVNGVLKAGGVTYPNTLGTATQVLTTDGAGLASWATPSASSTTVGAIGTATANGATITSGVLSLAPADETNGGIVTTTAQTIAGAKTFSADIIAHGVTIGTGAGAISTNTAIGVASLAANITGAANTATGNGSLLANTIGNANVANGYQALYTNSSGSNNTATGTKALYSNTIGNGNTANGFQSLYTNSIGSYNIANGYQSLYSNIDGNNNIANGYQALRSNTNGSLNIANGYQALFSNTIGSLNIANGCQALYYNTGNANTAYGYQALRANISGNSNTAIGNNSDVLTGTLSNATAIGNGAIVNTSNTIQLGNTSVTAITTSGNFINLNPTLVAINTSATATAANIVSGYITSSTAAAVTITLPTAAQIATSIGGTVSQGTSFEFSVENTGTTNAVTLAVGTGISVQMTPIITGSNNLIITAANNIGRFRLVFTSGMYAMLFRIY